MRTYCQAQVTSCHYPLNINKCIIIWWIDKALNWIKLTKGVATRSSLYWRHRNVRYNIGTMQHQITCFLMGGGGQPVCPNLCMQHMVKIYPRLEPVPTFPIFPLFQIFSRRVAVERILDDDSQDVSPLSTLLSWIKEALTEVCGGSSCWKWIADNVPCHCTDCSWWSPNLNSS